VASSLRWQRC